VEVRIGHIEYLGDQSIVYASLDGRNELIAIRAPADAAALQAGQQAYLQLPVPQCHIFDRSGLALTGTARHA
jgi:multiple sugar transport system ATP-binding protein